LFLTACIFVGHTQELVPNGSFESYERCPTESAQFNLLSHWKSASEATPDLLCTCASQSSLVNVNQNFAGRQKPRTGNCHAGFLAWHSDKYFEYIMVKLNTPLVKNKKYLLNFYYTLSDFSDKQVPQLGAAFKQEELKLREQPKITEYDLTDSIRNNIRLWQEFKKVYTAKGDEQYLLIGCFTEGLDRAYGDTPPEGYGPRDGDHFAYYYIDDVSLTTFTGNELTLNTPTQKIPPKKEKQPGKNPVQKDFVPQPIYFATDKSDILPKYNKSLDQLAQYMQQCTSCRLTVSGHTDNTGQDEINQPLSLERAQAVKNYLVQKGISATRINCTNHSSAQPVRPNTNASNKQRNRRVEITINKPK